MNKMVWKARWTGEQIRAMLLEQMEAFWRRDTGIERERLADVERAAALPHAVIVSGLRRVGKSTLLAQMAHRLGQESFYYLNFEDERLLGFAAQDANDLYQTLVEIFGERKIFFLDEVQNVADWERFVRRFMDLGFKFYITGSNASLLSRDLGTRLTGRYVPIELLPFSFREFLVFKNIKIPDGQPLTTTGSALLNASLNEYQRSGGIPEALKYPELSILRTLYDDVLYRDIAARYRLEGVQTLRELAYLLMSNPAGQVNYNKLKAQFQLGSVNTIRSYIESMENSWLLFSIRRFDFSLKRQQIAPKKVYCIDTGLVNAVGFRFSPNSGKLLENLVFLALRRRTRDIFYYITPGGYEVDFYLPETGQFIQVAQDLSSPVTRERETRALEDAAGAMKMERMLILSDRNEDEFRIGDLPVQVRSTAEWLLE
ncbi:ATP-binding protein [Longilinea arvoryzae]|nr:ATP-binding protein [Longilinea arvoryzae]